jgi:hypothetical protein
MSIFGHASLSGPICGCAISLAPGGGISFSRCLFSPVSPPLSPFAPLFGRFFWLRRQIGHRWMPSRPWHQLRLPQRRRLDRPRSREPRRRPRRLFVWGSRETGCFPGRYFGFDRRTYDSRTPPVKRIRTRVRVQPCQTAFSRDIRGDDLVNVSCADRRRRHRAGHRRIHRRPRHRHSRRVPRRRRHRRRAVELRADAPR